ERDDRRGSRHVRRPAEIFPKSIRETAKTGRCRLDKSSERSLGPEARRTQAMNGRDILRSIVIAATATLSVSALLAATPARAQFPDVLSPDECPGCAAALAASGESRFAGVWSSALTSATDPAWAPEDFACFIGCTPAARAHAATALLREIAAERDAYPLFEFACDPRGFAAQVVSPLPLKIEVSTGRITLNYEEHGAKRALPLV